MKLIFCVAIFICLFQATSQFAFRNDFEDDDILEVYDRNARDTDAITDNIEASGEEEPLPKKSVVKRDKPEAEIEASGHSSESSEEAETHSPRSRRSVEEIEGSGEDIAGRQRRVAGKDIIEASGEEPTATLTA